jgi:hypothetical protein
MYDAKVWDLSVVQGPFSVVPCQTLALRFATVSSLYAPLRSLQRRGRRENGGTVSSLPVVRPIEGVAVRCPHSASHTAGALSLHTPTLVLYGQGLDSHSHTYPWSQVDAIKSALQQRPVNLIQGPPGTMPALEPPCYLPPPPRLRRWLVWIPSAAPLPELLSHPPSPR